MTLATILIALTLEDDEDNNNGRLAGLAAVLQ